MNFYQNIFFVFLGILIILSYFHFQPKSNPNITFLSKKYLANILVENEDEYYDQFNENDLKIRNIESIDDYFDIIQNSCCDAPSSLKDKIVHSISKINVSFRNKIMKNPSGKPENPSGKAENPSGKTENPWGINLERFLALPWKIGFTCDSLYENGFPHTRNDIIILNVADATNRSETRLCRLLIHEKVHVYQKKFPEEIKTYLQNQSFLATKKDPNDKSIPANPDIDEFVYTKGKDSYYAKYDEEPTSFSDIHYSNGKAKYEHPYETMAYDIENAYP